MKKLISLLMLTALVLGLVACGGNDDSVVTPPEGGQDATSQSGGEDTPAPEEPQREALEAAFLTGLEKGPDYPEGKRITAVMVNNIAASRPTRGLSEAKVLYEIKVEGGITRFMALYEDYEALPTIGSIRSARDQFFQLIMPYWAFYVHDGESTVQKQYFLDWDYRDFDIKPEYGNMSYRDSTRQSQGYKTEYTEYTDAEHVAGMVQSRGLSDARDYNSTMFAFTRYDEAPRQLNEGECLTVPIIHSASYRTQMDYDAATGRYNMSQFSSSQGSVQPTVDENNGQQLAFDNVLVLFAPMTLYPSSELVKVDYFGGVGYYFNGGRFEMVYWSKGGAQEPLRLTNAAGGEGDVIELNPGTSYVGIVDDKELENFYNTVVSGAGQSAVAGGEVNTNEVETED